MKIFTAALGFVGVMAGAGPAQGQTASSAQPPSPAPAHMQDQVSDASFEPTDDPSWTLQFTALAYYVAPSGKLTLPSSGTRQNRVELNDLNSDSPLLSPYGGVAVRNGNWRFDVNGFYFSQSDRGAIMDFGGGIGDITFAPGDRLTTSLDFWTIDTSVGYRIFHREMGERPEGGHKLVLDITPLAGVRFVNVDFSIDRQGGGHAGDNLFFPEPVVGIRADLEVVEQFSIGLQSSLGYWPDTDLAWDIMPTFSWRPVPWFGAQIGYRQLKRTIKDGSGAGEFKWDGAMAGFLVGCEIRF